MAELVDRQLIAVANIGGTGAITPPPQTMPAELVDEHEKIVSAMKERKEECIHVDEIVEITGLEKEKVEEHFKILELNKFGVYSSENGEFCSWETIDVLKSRLEKWFKE